MLKELFYDNTFRSAFSLSLKKTVLHLDSEEFSFVTESTLVKTISFFQISQCAFKNARQRGEIAPIWSDGELMKPGFCLAGDCAETSQPDQTHHWLRIRNIFAMQF